MREINIKLLPKQAEAMAFLNDPEVTELLYGGSAGSGKSDFGVTWIIASALAYPGTRWLIGRSKLSQLKQTTMKSFRDVAKRYGVLAGVDWYWPSMQNEIRFANGSEVILKDLYTYPSDPDFDSLGSLELTGAFIDEASQISEKAFNTVKSRLRYKLKDFNLTPKILMTCNPSKNFLYPMFYIPERDRKLPKFRKFIKALPKDNPFLPESYLETLRTLDPISYQRLYLGNWEYDDDPMALVEYELIKGLFHNTHIEVEGKGTQLKDGTLIDGKWITVDPSYTGGDSTVCLVWDGLKIIDHLEYSGSKVSNPKTIEIITGFKNKWQVPNAHIIIDVGGGYGNAICEAFTDSIRFNGSSASPLKEYPNMRTHCFYKLAKHITDSEVWFPIDDPEMEQRVTQELEQLKRDRVDNDAKLWVVSKEKMKEGLRGKSPDYLDALSMRMVPLITKYTPPVFSFFVIDA